jgi:hypothetical protein
MRLISIAVGARLPMLQRRSYISSGAILPADIIAG